MSTLTFAGGPSKYDLTLGGGGGGIGQSVWKCEKGGGGSKEKWSHTLAKNLKQTLSINFFFFLWYENIRFEKYLGKGATGVFDGSNFF